MRLVTIFCIALSIAGCGEKNPSNSQPPAPVATATQTKSAAEMLADFKTDISTCNSAVLTFEKDRAFLEQFSDDTKRNSKSVEDFLRQASFANSEDIQYILNHRKYFVIDVSFHPSAFAVAWVKNEPVYCEVSILRLQEIEELGASPEAWEIRSHYLDRWLKDLQSPSNESDFSLSQYESFNRFVKDAAKLYSSNYQPQLVAWGNSAIAYFESQRSGLVYGAGGKSLIEQNKILDKEVADLTAILQMLHPVSAGILQHQTGSAPVVARTGGEFSYGKNTFINYWSCLGIYPGTSLWLEEKVWIFSKELPPTQGKVVHVIPAAGAQKRFDALGFDKVYKDKPLWAEIGCVHSFRGDMPEALARVTPDSENSDSLGFAIRGLPEGAWIAEGKGESVAMDAKDNSYVEVVRPLVTTACYAPDSLIRVKQFPVRTGHTIIQLDIGKAKKVSPEKRKQNLEEEMQRVERVFAKWAWPEYKKKTLEEWEKKDFLESVDICRFYLDEKRVLKSEKISRRTGVEERVETAPDLNTDNWADTTTSAVGFISLNEGKDWDALFLNIGWEGIGYSIERLNSSVELFNYSLYTLH